MSIWSVAADGLRPQLHVLDVRRFTWWGDAGEVVLMPPCAYFDSRSHVLASLRACEDPKSVLTPDFVGGRYVIDTSFRGRKWEVVVEPDEIDHLLVVVTAYKVES